MQELGKGLLVVGLLIALVGLFLWKLAGRTPLGRLPGDIFVQRQNVTFYFPVVTCLLVSLVLTLLLWLWRR